MADHVSTVNGIYQAFGTGDVGWILDQLADDVAWDHGLGDFARHELAASD